MLIYPVKNMTLTPMEISCHFSSQLDLVAVWSKSTPNSMTIPCHLSTLYLFSMPDNDMDFGQVQVMEFMAFAKEMMGFPSDFISFSNQIKLPSKRHEKI